MYNPDRTRTIKWEWHGDTKISKTEDYRSGYYDEEAQQVDKPAYNAPGYLMVVAAGNNRTESGRPKALLITWNSRIKPVPFPAAPRMITIYGVLLEWPKTY
ncbi:hypothetical protein AHMF7605_02915 [Adhaeribacter arboris]|uniref:Uncharacterized protein n=1 Tax=Adhaeribacter arboris TaxID=2072846 RepID=A0A2T2YAL2_9BACT|nr:hypothetical protein [Adhaeribacter arboris]PSR52549.1 hypothetical protein AHMF7605_02915 [Adhaeribacter arboris]